MAAKSIVVNFELGHRAIVKHQKTSEGFTHDWEVFVQGVGGALVEGFVEGVVFYLHESFSNPQRVMKTPPFLVRERGYGGFILPIEIYFKASDDIHRKTKINYDLFLQSVDSAPIHHTIKEKITFFKPKEDFRKLLLLGGAIEETIPEDSKKSSQSSVSRPASGGKTKPRYDSNGASKLEQGDPSMRKFKDSSGKQDSGRHRDRHRESSRVKDSSQKESNRAKDSLKLQDFSGRDKKVLGKQKHKELPGKTNESFMKSSFAKHKEQQKPKTVKVSDTFSELFGEIIRKGDPPKTDKKQQKAQIKAPETVVVAGGNQSKESKSKKKAEKDKTAGKDKFKIKDYYKGQTEQGPEQTRSQTKVSAKKAKSKENVHIKQPEAREADSIAVHPKKGSLKGKRGSTPEKEVVPEKKPLTSKQKKALKKKGKKDIVPEPEKERQVPVTPPTPRKRISSLAQLSSSSDSSCSGSRSRSHSGMSESSSRSRRRSRSRSDSRQMTSRSRSRSTYSEKSHSRSPQSVKNRKSLSKSPSSSRSRSDSAMSRSSSSSSFHSSVSVEALKDSASNDHSLQIATGEPLSAIIQDNDRTSTESDDEKRFQSSGEEVLPSAVRKSYSKRRTSEMSSLPSSRHSSCHSGKGTSSSSESESTLKKRRGKEKKRRNKKAAKLKRREAKEMAERAEAGIPSTPSARCDTDKSDSEMAQDPPETFTVQAQRENVDLLERIRQLVIHEEYDKLQDIMRIVGRRHTIQDNCIAIDYYKLSRISRLKLKTYMDRLANEQ